MLYNAAHDYSPEDVNFYILDFSSKLLNIFKDTPHCGVYLTDEDEDSLERFFKFLTEMIETRTKLFDEAKVNSDIDLTSASDRQKAGS
jgi:S-DNA-T family DNA segregation ATPase FtsK/SpoIIIE